MNRSPAISATFARRTPKEMLNDTPNETPENSPLELPFSDELENPVSPLPEHDPDLLPGMLIYEPPNDPKDCAV